MTCRAVDTDVPLVKVRQATLNLRPVPIGEQNGLRQVLAALKTSVLMMNRVSETIVNIFAAMFEV